MPGKEKEHSSRQVCVKKIEQISPKICRAGGIPSKPSFRPPAPVRLWRRSDPFGPACLPSVRQAGRQVGRFQVFLWRQILLIRKFEIQTLPFLSMPFAIQEFKFTFIINYFMCPALINQFSDFISGIFTPLNKSHKVSPNSAINPSG